MRFYFSLLAILLFLAGCDSPPQSNDTVAPSPQQDSERLVVGTTANYPPIVFLSKQGIIGIEADFAAALAEELDRELEIVDMPWGNLADALQSGEVDVVMAGVSVTEHRKQLAAFTNPYMETGQMALIRMADLGTLGAPGDIQEPGRIIGVENNTTGQRFAEQAYPEATIKTFDSAGAGTRALREKQIDYFIHDAPTIWLVTLNNNAAGMQDILALYYPLTREKLAWAVNKNNTALLESLNDGLHKMQQDGRAQRIINKWIRSRVIVTPPVRPVEF